MVRFALRRVFWSIAVLLCVTYVSFLTQGLAMRSRSNQLAPVGEVASQELGATVGMLRRLSHGDLGLYKRPIGEHYRGSAVVRQSLLRQKENAAIRSVWDGGRPDAGWSQGLRECAIL